MARCDNNKLLNKIGLQTLNEQTEIDFRIRTDLPDCRKINTKDFVDISDAYTYNRYRKPENRFECMRSGCVNTGLLMLSVANETVDYRALYNATEFATGLVTFYVYPGVGATYPITVTMTVSDDSAFTNADVFEVAITADMVTGDGFVPVTVDLNDPTSDVGTGWTASAGGAYIRFTADQIIGLSSIAIFDSIEDFETNDVVTIGCITTQGGTFDVELVEAACQDAKYNDQITSLTYPITGTKATPNYWKLNPLMGKGSSVNGFDMTTVERAIEAYAVGTDNYGKVTLADVNQDVCGYIAVQIADSCDVTDASLTMLSIPTIADVDEGHFQVIKNDDGTTDVIFNAALVGMNVLVRYPKAVQIEETVANVDNLNGTHVSMTVPVLQSDGVKLIYVFENVFVTSFPATISSDTAEFAFTITIARDADGNFFRIQRIVG